MQSLHDFKIINIFHIRKINYTITVYNIWVYNLGSTCTLTLYQPNRCLYNSFTFIELIFHKVINNFTNMRERERERERERKRERERERVRKKERERERVKRRARRE